MKTLKIQKIVNGQHENTINVPVALVDVLTFILPKSAVSELQQHGIDLPALTAACKEGVAYTRTIELREGGVLKQVIISVA